MHLHIYVYVPARFYCPFPFIPIHVCYMTHSCVSHDSFMHGWGPSDSSERLAWIDTSEERDKQETQEYMWRCNASNSKNLTSVATPLLCSRNAREKRKNFFPVPLPYSVEQVGAVAAGVAGRGGEGEVRYVLFFFWTALPVSERCFFWVTKSSIPSHGQNMKHVRLFWQVTTVFAGKKEVKISNSGNENDIF